MNYLQVIAEKIKAEVHSSVLPDAPHIDTLFALYAVLLLAKGEKTTAEDVHNAWVAWISQKNADHTSIRPFVELSTDVQQEDEPFAEAIRQAARSLKE